MILSRRSLLAAAGLALPGVPMAVSAAEAAAPKRLPSHAKHTAHSVKSHTHTAKAHAKPHRKTPHATANNTGAAAVPAHPPSDT